MIIVCLGSIYKVKDWEAITMKKGPNDTSLVLFGP